jgi:peptide chain release factor 2
MHWRDYIWPGLFLLQSRARCSPTKLSSSWTRWPRSWPRCGGTFDIPAKSAQLAQLEAQRAEPGFWDDAKRAAGVSQQIAALGGTIESYTSAERAISDLQELWLLLQEGGATESDEDWTAFERELSAAMKTSAALEVETLLGGEHDEQAALVSINAGAGGRESADWAEMLFRMYGMWAANERLELEVTDDKPAEGGGLQSVSFRLAGRHAYGYMKCEHGIHRLVRISPFDNAKRRHTSFAGVEVIPEIPADADIELRDDDVKMDVYRASSAGGQHVNKTSSAVRLTHVPTGIIVACQNERSQHQNRDVALRMLKSKLAALMEEQHKERVDELRGVQADIAWGNQIRSYVLHPYQMVKDLRTGQETSNTQRVLDGELNEFIWSCLRWMKSS